MSILPNSSPQLSRTRSLSRIVRALALVAVPVLLLLGAPGLGSAQKPATDAATANRALAYQALQEGRVDDAANLLRPLLAVNPSDSYAHQLFCRVNYAQEQADEAIQQCEMAVASPAANREQDSDNQLWLGRAYGMKARHAGPIAGFSLARKVQARFARAVELNPNSVAALNDLGEYDVSAPFLVGGGSDKAAALAARIMPQFPGAAHLLRARIANAGNDLTSAESEFKQEVAVQRTPEAWIDLAQFYQAHNRPDDAVSAVKSSLAADHTHGPALVDAASILTAAHRAPDLAEHCLRDYLASRAKSDAAPAFKVHIQLGRLLTARGDTRDASREFAAATALAPAFARSVRPVQGL